MRVAASAGLCLFAVLAGGCGGGHGPGTHAVSGGVVPISSGAASQLRGLPSASFTGSVAGRRVRITLDTGETWSGTLVGARLRLAYPLSDGSLQTLEFRSASAADYDAAAARTRRQVDAAGAAERDRRATASAQQQADVDATTLAGDFPSLLDDTRAVEGDTLAADLTALRAAACAERTFATVEDDAAAIQRDLMTLFDDLAAVEQDAENVTTDGFVVPGYQPAAATPSRARLVAAEAAAQAAATGARRRIRAGLATATRLTAACGR